LGEVVKKLVDLSRAGEGDQIINFLNEIIPDAEIKHNVQGNPSSFDL